MSKIYVQFILQSKVFDLLKIYVSKLKDWQIFWYEITDNDNTLIFVCAEFTYKTEINNRNKIVYDITEIFEEVRMIAVGYRQMWSVMSVRKDITHYHKVFYHQTEMFLSSLLISYLDHELWKDLFLPVRKVFRKMSWHLYHFNSLTDIDKYTKGTLKRTKKSGVYLPEGYSLLNLDKVVWIQDVWQIPLEINTKLGETLTLSLRNGKKSRLPVLKK